MDSSVAEDANHSAVLLWISRAPCARGSLAAHLGTHRRMQQALAQPDLC